MMLAQHSAAVQRDTKYRTRNRTIRPEVHRPDGVLWSLLQGQARTSRSAATAFYLMIGDPDHMPDRLDLLHVLQNDAASRTPGGVSHRTAINRDFREMNTSFTMIVDNVVLAATTLMNSGCTAPRSDLDRLASILIASTIEAEEMVSLLQHGLCTTRLSPVIAGILALDEHGARVVNELTRPLATDSTRRQVLHTEPIAVYTRVAQAISLCGVIAASVKQMTVKYPTLAT